MHVLVLTGLQAEVGPLDDGSPLALLRAGGSSTHLATLCQAWEALSPALHRTCKGAPGTHSV